MFRVISIGIAMAALAIGAIAASTDAPADEYFGPFKYSAISVRMKINALGRSYHERWADDASIVHDAGLIESSFRVWAQKYPKDRWLAPTAFHLAQLYQDVQANDARAHARAMYEFLVKNYPSSKEAHLARARLASGFPALHAESPVSPTPNPYTASASASPSAEPSPAPASSAPASSAPASTPPSTGPSAAPSPGPTTTPKR
jgi:hypothetical protein